jgi:hypothetical protein
MAEFKKASDIRNFKKRVMIGEVSWKRRPRCEFSTVWYRQGVSDASGEPSMMQFGDGDHDISTSQPPATAA